MKVLTYKSLTDGIPNIDWSDIKLGILNSSYMFNDSHMTLDILLQLNNYIDLKTTIFNYNNTNIYDADDVAIEIYDYDYDTQYIVIYSDEHGPLFLYTDLSEFPIKNGALLNIEFSDNFNKIFSVDSNNVITFGNIALKVTQKTLSAVQNDIDKINRSGLSVGRNEELDKNLIKGKKSIYKDMTLSCLPHPLTGDITTVSGVSAINQALKNLLLTNLYERPFTSWNYAGNLTQYLFEYNDSTTQDLIKETIINTIHNHEPRIIVMDIQTESILESYELKVRIVYKIKTSDILETFNIILERV